MSKNSEDPAAKEDLQQEILKLLRKNPDLAREIEVTINLNIENIENIDQFAVGNYNTFFNFETPSGDELIKIIEYLDQRRKEASNQEILSRYNPSNLPYYPEKLKQFVTQNRADELRKDLTYLENHRILLLSGIGGVGKSTLARALVDLRPVNVPEPFWFNFNQNQNAKLGDILEKLAAYMKAPYIASFKAERREPGKTDVDKLTGELHRRSEVWLIFDDLSTVLEDQQFTDKGIELLFSSLRYNDHKAKVIVTSRTLPKLENGESLVDVIEGEEKHHLNGLRKEFAVNYLVSNGLDKVGTQKLEELAVGVDGHPLALRLLVQLVKEYGANDILEDLSMYRDQMEDTILKARKLFDKLAGNEKEFLEHISVYRKPVAIKALKAMFTEKTPRDSVSKLLNKSLLETNHNGSYWLHPLIQEFAYKGLKDITEAHANAYIYYVLFPLPKKPSKIEDLQSLIEAHYHACSAGRVDLAARILYHSNVCGQLEMWGNFKTIVELCTPLLPNISLEGRIISLECHGYFLGILGIACFKLGIAEEAIILIEEALKIARLRENKKGEANQLGNLGLAYQQLGDRRKSIEYYKQVIKITKDIRDQLGEGTSYVNLGNVYLELGEIEQTIINYKSAGQIFRYVGNKRGEGSCFSNLGILYSQIGNIDEGIDFLEQSLNIFKDVGDKIGEKNQYMNLGIAYKNIGMFKKSIDCYEKSLKISIELENKSDEGDLLGNIGNLF
ncbi:tetratricopeptide repeat protein [Methanosarcina sp. WH1]|uniref:tetratricopeptide repeat protein n=1 Tax=Methanosarcina sp. WH1 TaxID=1434102 RepID=UPI0018CD5724|nr:tetratricopeptide repeat protein [Methanosarcina sp. WH1]